jgi:predicted nucleotidyltransferase
MKNLNLPAEKIEAFCRRNHISKLSLFDSTLRDNFKPTSDVDILVEFEPVSQIGLIKMVSIEIELSQILGRKVDLRTPHELSRYLRQDIVESAQ